MVVRAGEDSTPGLDSELEGHLGEEQGLCHQVPPSIGYGVLLSQEHSGRSLTGLLSPRAMVTRPREMLWTPAPPGVRSHNRGQASSAQPVGAA